MFYKRLHLHMVCALSTECISQGIIGTQSVLGSLWLHQRWAGTARLWLSCYFHDSVYESPQSHSH